MQYFAIGFLWVLFESGAAALPPSSASSAAPDPPKPSFHGRFTRDTVDAYMTKIGDIYREEITKRGAVLVLHNYWNSDVNTSYAWQTVGTHPMQYHVKMEGGFLRHPGMTEETLVYGICHEFGHHLGGVPLKASEDRLKLGIRASVEGQADYFAGMICFKRVFADNIRDLTEEEDAQIPDALQRSCRQVYGSGSRFKLCLMGLSAGLTYVEIITEGISEPVPKLDRRDPTIVDQTLEGYPSRQCRVDTVVAGTLCDGEESLFFEEPTQGICGSESGDQMGRRPQCWFKP